jgi:leucyl/phenylalanyl-tRNA--protein transferase
MMTRASLSDIGALFSEGIEPEPPLPPAVRRQRRLETLRESVPAGVRRLAMVAFNHLRRRPLASLPATLDLILRESFIRSGTLPNPRAALPGAEGLAGLAPELSPATMMEAYSCGLCPSASLGPIAWHSPERRLIAAPAALARSVALRAASPLRGLGVTFDRDADSILIACAHRSDCAGLTPERLTNAFANLFDAGYGHCFEVRDEGGRIVAGGYGVAAGRVFVLERVFSRRPEAWKAGLARLAQSLRDWDFEIVECGAGAAWLCESAFDSVSRDAHLETLAEHMRGDRIGRWPCDGARTPTRARAARAQASRAA